MQPTDSLRLSLGVDGTRELLCAQLDLVEARTGITPASAGPSGDVP